MKRTLYLLVLLAAAVSFIGCDSSSKNKCIIEGTTNPRFDNKKIFLVPLNGPQDAEHVDSVVVKDCKFRFEKDTTLMAVIRVDYHVRTGVQDLLVVTEPGRLTVVIDSISSSSGTPQNDSLNHWKSFSEQYNKERAARMRATRMARLLGDTATITRLQTEMDSIYDAHKQRTRQLAASMPEGVLKEFLEGVFPRSYKKRMPDGSIVTIDNE